MDDRWFKVGDQTAAELAWSVPVWQRSADPAAVGTWYGEAGGLGCRLTSRPGQSRVVEIRPATVKP